MKDNSYYYAVTRIHNNEANLLSDQTAEQLRTAGTYESCLTALKSHGWSVEENMRFEDIIRARREKTWMFLNEVLGESPVLNVFKYENDFNNLKSIIRLRYVKRAHELESYISPFGTLTSEALGNAAASGSFDALPDMFAAPAGEALKVLLQTGNAQLSDVMMDRACIEALHTAAQGLGSEVMDLYLDMKADTANIAIAVRGLRMEKTADFFDIAMTECGNLSKQELTHAALKDMDAVCGYLSGSKYADYAALLKSSLPAFLAAAESRFIEEIKLQKYNISGANPIIAFMIARENEIKTVRLLLSSKINHFSGETVTGRLRRLYV